MDLILVVLLVAFVGFCVWMITTRIPMPPLLATVIQVFAVIALGLYLLSKLQALPNVLP